jgi:hypothetical protein
MHLFITTMCCQLFDIHFPNRTALFCTMLMVAIGILQMFHMYRSLLVLTTTHHHRGVVGGEKENATTNIQPHHHHLRSLFKEEEEEEEVGNTSSMNHNNVIVLHNIWNMEGPSFHDQRRHTRHSKVWVAIMSRRQRFSIRHEYKKLIADDDVDHGSTQLVPLN